MKILKYDIEYEFIVESKGAVNTPTTMQQHAGSPLNVWSAETSYFNSRVQIHLARLFIRIFASDIKTLGMMLLSIIIVNGYQRVFAGFIAPARGLTRIACRVINSSAILIRNLVLV